jgi:hypothetical protein
MKIYDLNILRNKIVTDNLSDKQLKAFNKAETFMLVGQNLIGYIGRKAIFEENVYNDKGLLFFSAPNFSYVN